jgi:hypothetical protein
MFAVGRVTSRVVFAGRQARRRVKEQCRMHVRIGELLGRVTPLSNHDVAEILETQSGTRRRFGEIALSWGLCKPHHLWWAWAEQCVADKTMVDLNTCGVDATAVMLLSSEQARQLGVLPLRSFDNELILATATPDDRLEQELSRIVHKNCKLVLADAQQIREAIDTFYPHAA